MNLLLALGLVLGQDPSPEKVRNELQRILNEPEFKEKMPSEFWGELRRALKMDPLDWRINPPKVNPPRGPAVSSGFLEVLKTVAIIIGIALLAGIIVFLVYKLVTRKDKPKEEAALPPAAPQGDLAEAISQSPLQWLAGADEYFRKGRIQDAIRAVYLSVLSAAHQRNWIEYAPGRTDWDYVRRFGGPVFRGGFRPAVRFGYRPAFRGGFRRGSRVIFR